MKTITEGKTSIFVEVQKIVDKKMPVFYNPVMIINRDFSLLALSALNRVDLRICDPLAGSGIRTLRILKELNNEELNNEKRIVAKIVVNDLKPNFLDLFQKNLELNDLNKEHTDDANKIELIVTSDDANKTLNSNGHFDYVDIDPFGSPNPFLDSAIRSLNRNALLAVTATDTSALCGSYPSACRRKYWAEPLRNELMHEFASRILIRKVQLVGAQHDKALIPVFTYATDHYIKIFFKSISGKTKADEILKNHKYYDGNTKGDNDVHDGTQSLKGPIWMGDIQDVEFVEKMLTASKNLDISKKTIKLLEQINDESKISTPFFVDIHTLASKKKSTIIPKLESIMTELISRGFLASRTHFSLTGIKTNANFEVVDEIFSKLTK